MDAPACDAPGQWLEVMRRAGSSPHVFDALLNALERRAEWLAGQGNTRHQVVSSARQDLCWRVAVPKAHAVRLQACRTHIWGPCLTRSAVPSLTRNKRMPERAACACRRPATHRVRQEPRYELRCSPHGLPGSRAALQDRRNRSTGVSPASRDSPAISKRPQRPPTDAQQARRLLTRPGGQ